MPLLPGFIRDMLTSRRRARKGFTSSADYWEQRYAKGGTSGDGSFGRLAHFKADTLNQLVREHSIQSVVELGCGDGNQLTLAEYPRYTGLDVSPRAIELCRERFAGDPTKSFAVLAGDEAPAHPPAVADLALSLDVIYHLVEDDVFDRYMSLLFACAKRLVVIYASNKDERVRSVHVRHRRFTDWIETNQPKWAQIQHIPNPYPFDAARPSETSFADFYVFERRD